MYELLRYSLASKLLPQQILSGGLAFIIANEFYKFHSFGLECVAFLTTWGIFDFFVHKVSELFSRKRRR